MNKHCSMSKWHNLLFCWDLSSGTSEGFGSSAGGPADTNHQRRECSLVRMWLDSSPHVPAEPPIKGQERCSNCNGNDITEMNQCSKVRPWGCTSIPLERTRTALKRLDFLMTFLWCLMNCHWTWQRASLDPPNPPTWPHPSTGGHMTTYKR